MWPRVTEAWLGAWLMLSPLILRGTVSVETFALRDAVAGAVVVVLSLASFWRRTAWAHLLTAAVALGLGLLAYFGGPRPGPPAAQNEITVALLLLLFAVIPNEANRPPGPWRKPCPPG